MSIVSKPTTKEYEENFDRIFGKKQPVERPEICGGAPQSTPDQSSGGRGTVDSTGQGTRVQSGVAQEVGQGDRSEQPTEFNMDRTGVSDRGRGFISSGT